MNFNFIHKDGVIKKSLRFLFFISLFQIQSYSQTISNLDVFYNLVDSASGYLFRDLTDVKKVSLEMNFGTDYSIFANQVRGKLIKNGIQLIGNNVDSLDVVRVNFVLDNALVEYSEPEKNGIFGEFLTERKIELSGNYFISGKSQINDFNLVEKDTINVEDVEKIENRSYPFTQGELPPEPFFSSLLEPIVAISAAAVTVILFFTVRSK
ncbi:MAG: hypothetical protein WAU11_08565 [Ignavibacteriaceae bacterium]